MSAPVVAAIATAAALTVLTAGWLLLMRREGRRCREHARKVMAARRIPRPDGSHEALDVPGTEWARAEYFARRYPSLGREVIR
jgi:hypothetical protein